MHTIELTGWGQQGGRAFAPAVEEESRSSRSSLVGVAAAASEGELGAPAHLAGRGVDERRFLWVAVWVGSFGDMPRGARQQGWDFQPGIVTRSGRLSRPG